MLMNKGVEMNDVISSKPFPWKCGECGEYAVLRQTFAYALEMQHDGRMYSINIPDLRAPRCTKCEKIVIDSEASRQVSAELRRHVGLLTPEEIRANREKLKLTQKQLADQLGIAESTLCRWETGGQIQQRAMDRMLRLFFTLKAVREALADEKFLATHR